MGRSRNSRRERIRGLPPWLDALICFLAKALFLTLIALLVIVLLPLALLAWPVVRYLDRRTIRQHRASVNGKRYFIYRRRRQWGDFIVNNVLPVLDPDVRPIDATPPLSNEQETKSAYWALCDSGRRQPSSVRHPYLLDCTFQPWAAIELHTALLPLKRLAKRSVETQSRVRSSLSASLRGRGPGR